MFRLITVLTAFLPLSAFAAPLYNTSETPVTNTRIVMEAQSMGTYVGSDPSPILSMGGATTCQVTVSLANSTSLSLNPRPNATTSHASQQGSALVISSDGTHTFTPGTANFSFQFQAAGKGKATAICSSGLSGDAVMLTAEIAGNACAASEVSKSAVGIASTDVVTLGFQSDPSLVAGYGAGAADGLVIYGYPGSDVALFKVCNVTASPITPGAMTINWQVVK